MTEEERAARLAEWLDDGRAPSPTDEAPLEPEVIEAVLAIAPHRAPALRGTADDVLALVRSGPLHRPGPIHRPGPVATDVPDVHVTPANRARPWWASAGLATALAAAVALIAVRPWNGPERRDLDPLGVNAPAPTAPPPAAAEADRPASRADAAPVAEATIEDEMSAPPSAGGPMSAGGQMSVGPMGAPPAKPAPTGAGAAAADRVTIPEASREARRDDFNDAAPYAPLPTAPLPAAEPAYDYAPPPPPPAAPAVTRTPLGATNTATPMEEAAADEERAAQTIATSSRPRAKREATQAAPAAATSPVRSVDVAGDAPSQAEVRQESDTFPAARTRATALAAAGDLRGAAAVLDPWVRAPASQGQAAALQAARWLQAAGDRPAALRVVDRGLALGSAPTTDRAALVALRDALQP